MRYLLDASALVELFLSLEAKSLVGILRKCCILDLTVYEFCNALWKLAKIRKQISEETADWSETPREDDLWKQNQGHWSMDGS